MKAVFTILLFSFALTASAVAQDGTPFKGHHQLGFAASTLSGSGLSYQFIFNDTWRLKATGLIDIDDASGFYELDYNIGLELQQSLHKSSATRFYALAGASSDYRHVEDQYRIGDREEVYTLTEEDFNIGAGLGFELQLWQHLALNLDGNYHFTNSDGGKSKSFNFGGGIGIAYRF